MPLLSKDLIMASDIEQDNFFPGDLESKRDPVATGEGHGKYSIKIATQGMVIKPRLERILF